MRHGRFDACRAWLAARAAARRLQRLAGAAALACLLLYVAVSIQAM